MKTLNLPIGDSFCYGCLRSLRVSDVEGMLEWMHDPSIASVFQVDFMSKRQEDAKQFIETSWQDTSSVNLAIVNNLGEYLGTVSLKNIDWANSAAEYAIATRRVAHGTGIALAATNSILEIAFEGLNLHRVFLDVREDNPRAIRFYQKAGFKFEGKARDALLVDDEYINLFYYSILKTERVVL